MNTTNSHSTTDGEIPPDGQDVSERFEAWAAKEGLSDSEAGVAEVAWHASWQAALAARQPVDFDDKELQFYREHIGNNLDNMLMAAGVFEVTHEGGYEACWANSMDALKRLIDRQPVGQVPVMYRVRCQLHPGWREVDAAQFTEYTSYGWEGQRLFAAPPAQTVDLKHEVAMADLRATLVRISESQPGDNPAALARDALALVDSQTKKD